MTCSSNTTFRPELYRARAVLSAAVVAALVLLAAPSQGQAPGWNEAGGLIDEARQFLARGDGIAAEVRLKQALGAGVPRPAVAAYMGEALLDQGRPEFARPWLETGNFSPSTTAQGFRMLALLERGDGDLHAASRAYDRALAVAPNDPGLWVEIARLRYAGGDHLLAIEAADHALALDPDSVRALELRGQLLRDRDGLLPSLQWFRKAHELAPDDISVLGEYAATLGDAGETVKMLALTRRMLQIDPGNARAYYLQAVLAARAGRYDLARSLLKRSGSGLAEVPGAMLLEGVVEIAARNYTLAAEALEPLVRLQPGNARAQNLLARALFLAGDHAYLVERFGAQAARRDASPFLQVLVARAYENLDRRDLAAPLLENAARADRASVRMLGDGTLVGELLAQGRTGEAENLADQWVARNPGYFDHQELAGDVRLAAGRPRDALEYYARAAKIRMSESLMERCVEAMLETGADRQAAGLANAFLINNPASPDAQRLAGRLAARTGDWRKARVLYERLRANGGARDVRLLSDLALVQLRSGDAVSAEATAKAAYRLQRSNPLAAQAWGLSLATLGKDRQTARALLAKARAIMGDTPLLAEGRERLGPFRDG